MSSPRGRRCNAGPEALDERVRLLDHSQPGLAAVGLLEVDTDRPPAAVQHLHPPGVESALDRLRAVDAHHVGAHVGEQHRRERPRPDACDLNDLHVRQRSHAATLATVLCMVETLASGYGLVEGPTVDGDGNLYFSDVLGGGVYRRDPDGDITTVVPKRRRVAALPLHPRAAAATGGAPRAFPFPPRAADGLAVDAQGLRWGGSARAGCVARMTPDGEIDRVLEVPAQTGTSLCFAGPDQHDLFVVTADNTE